MIFTRLPWSLNVLLRNATIRRIILNNLQHNAIEAANCVLRKMRRSLFYNFRNFMHIL